MGIFDVVNYMMQGINLFVSAIQWFFNQIITIFTSFFGVLHWIYSALQIVYSFSTFVPAWLWAFALAWISYRLFVFVKKVGGD